jgi:uncharacterized membrane protein
MTSLSTIGIVHTVVSLVALTTGAASLAREGEIRPSGGLGLTYLATTLVTAATALVIFRHGAPTPGHALAVLTLAGLAAAVLASRTTLFGVAARAVAVTSLSATFLFHLIPGVTETLTRLPAGDPVLASPDAPALKAIYGALVVAFALGLRRQLRRVRAERGRSTRSVHGELAG